MASTITKVLRVRDLTTIQGEVNDAIETLYGQGYDVSNFKFARANDQFGSDEGLLTIYATPAQLPRSATFTFTADSMSFPFWVFVMDKMAEAETDKDAFIRAREINGARLIKEASPWNLPGSVLGRRHVSFLLFGPSCRDLSYENKVVAQSRINLIGTAGVTSGTGAVAITTTGDQISYTIAGSVFTSADSVLEENISSSNLMRFVDDTSPTFGANLSTSNDTTRYGYICLYNRNVNGTVTPTSSAIWGAEHATTAALPTDDQVIAQIDAIVAGSDGGGAADTWSGVALVAFGVSCIDTAGTDAYANLAASGGANYAKAFARGQLGLIHKTVPTYGVLSSGLAAGESTVDADDWYVGLSATTVRLNDVTYEIAANDDLDLYPASAPTFSADDKRYWVAVFVKLVSGVPTLVPVAGTEANTASAVYPTEAQIAAVVGATTSCACLGVFSATRTAGPVYTLANFSVVAPWVRAHNYNYITV
jgi:hypothetical protein